MTAREILERRAVISGLGQSEIGRRLDQSSLELAVDACLAATSDAGLTVEDIDGVATYPGYVTSLPGFSPAGVAEVQDALRLQLSWYNGAFESPGQLGSVATACAAVAAGYARHVLCFRVHAEGSAQGMSGRAGVTAGAEGQRVSQQVGGFDPSWFLPFGAASPVNLFAMYAQRHFHVFGTTRQQLAQVALTARANAGRNPKAIYRDALTLSDYFGARMVSSPLSLYDCDVPCDGATALVVSAVDTVPDLRCRPVRIEAVGSGLRGRPGLDQWEDLTTMALRDAARMMWSRTDLTAADVDVAELYDGFSIIALMWLEGLDFCKHGEGGSFIADGARIAFDGELPINTHGGQLSAGRVHGYGHLFEACLQLRGEAGEHQLERKPEVAVATAGGGTTASCLLLTQW